ncbi:MAG TPA: iron-containing alcohol dehydrogenase [Roseiflexaceae bacterium]|nr:iron-containing alcohol dehydrogenase [Roseiflexaceae bacterium]
MSYEFATATRIIGGPGSSAELAALVEGIGKRALLVRSQGATGRGGPTEALAQALAARGLIAAVYSSSGEPDVATVEAAAREAREAGCDCVVGIGGGSVLDTAKAAAALAANTGGALEYMEVAGGGRPLESPALPVIAVPTTAGTGSEVTRNAVVGAVDRKLKASIRHASMLPQLALVDSTLTHELPAGPTTSGGMDALTQLIEADLSRRAMAITDGLCLIGLEGMPAALRRAVQVPADPAARETLSRAALLSGMALANADLGAVHAIAAPLGGAYPVPHGVACAVLLPPITTANIAALRRSDPGSAALARYRRVAAIVADTDQLSDDAALDRLCAVLRTMIDELAIPRLASYGVSTADLAAIAAAAARTSNARNNPVALSEAELSEALAQAL